MQSAESFSDYSEESLAGLSSDKLHELIRQLFNWLFKDVIKLCMEPEDLPLHISTNAGADEWSTVVWRTMQTIAVSDFVVSVEGAETIPEAPAFWTSFMNHFRQDQALANLYKAEQKKEQGSKSWLKSFDSWLYFYTNGLCSGAAEAAWQGKYEEVFRFVSDTYAETYGLGADYTQKLRFQSLVDSHKTRYVIVRSKQDGTILGLLRLVAAPYGRRYVVKANKDSDGTQELLLDESGPFGPAVADPEKIPVSVMYHFS